MEEEKKELKQESVKKEEKKIHKKIKKKFLLLVPVLIALGVGVFFIFRETGVINKYVYEEVDNLAEREGVCFDNLLFSYAIKVDRGDQRETRWLCIMNNGDVYAFEWPNRSPWDFCYDGTEKISETSSELHSKGYEEANWGKMENVVYLGRFSDSAVRRLNSYVENFDIINGEYYYLTPPPQATGPAGGSGQQESGDINEEGNEVKWRGYVVTLYWHDPPENYSVTRKYDLIESCYMYPTWWGGYEKEIRSKSLDENAIAAIKLFESSGFYSRWVRMCLKGY